MTIIDPQDDFGPSTAERLTREFGDGVNATPLSNIGAPEPDAHWADLLADNPAQTPTPPVAQHHIDTMTEQTALAQLANGMDPAEVERKRIETRAAMQKAIVEAVPIELPAGWADAPPVKVVTTAELIESAEILKRALVEAENAFEAETKPMRAKLKEAEDALRAKALAAGESIKGAHIQVQIVAPSATVKWDDKGLTGAVAMLPENWKAAILAHRKTDEKPATTRVVYK